MQDEDAAIQNPRVELRVSEHEGWVNPPWFELDLHEHGWAALYLRLENGSRTVCQTLRLILSNAYDPLPDFARLAEHAWSGDLSYTFSFDSEGPETRVSLLPGPADRLAVLDIRDDRIAAVYLVAVVDARTLGIALAHALQVAIRNPAMAERWAQWYDLADGPDHTQYFGSAWLRDLVIDPHPHPDYYWDGIDTANADRYRWTSWQE